MYSLHDREASWPSSWEGRFQSQISAVTSCVTGGCGADLQASEPYVYTEANDLPHIIDIG